MWWLQYPPWLEEHKATLPADQYDNYCKQLEIMKKLVAEFEAESESDSEDVKRQRFQKIMDNMQQVFDNITQSYSKFRTLAFWERTLCFTLQIMSKLRIVLCLFSS